MKINHVLTVGIACCALLLTAPASLAQDAKQKRPHERGQSRLVLLLDTDGGGKISSAEIAEDDESIELTEVAIVVRDDFDSTSQLEQLFLD